jgi:hypothetical protein
LKKIDAWIIISSNYYLTLQSFFIMAHQASNITEQLNQNMTVVSKVKKTLSNRERYEKILRLMETAGKESDLLDRDTTPTPGLLMLEIRF